MDGTVLTAQTGRSRRTTDSATLQVSIQQQKFLLRMVKTLSRKLKKADDRIKRYQDKQHHYQDLTVQLTKAEEQLEYATEENNEFSTRVRALEQALLMQETELDQAVVTIRDHEDARRKRELLQAEQATNPFAADDAEDRIKTEEELARVMGELQKLNMERDTAVNKATQLSIQLAEIRAEADEFRDQLSECRLVIAQLRERQEQSPNSVASKRGFFWAKKDSASVASVDHKSVVEEEEDVTEPTEDSTSYSSGDWPHSDMQSDASGEHMDYKMDQRGLHEAAVELTL